MNREQTTDPQALPTKYEMVTCIKAIGAVRVGNRAEVSSIESNQVNLYGAGCGRYEHVPSDLFWEHFTREHQNNNTISKTSGGELA